jgi:hypothetical protein
MTPSLHSFELKRAFANREEITISDLIQFYIRLDGQITRPTLDWKIYELNRNGIIHRIGRGLYSLKKPKYLKTFNPDITPPIKRLHKKLQQEFPYVNMCLWSTKILNEFMLHQPGRFYTIVEVEIEAIQSVFYSLREQGKEVFVEPNIEIINQYVINSNDPIIIIRLIKESPLQLVEDVPTITIEKLLVDLYCNKVLFSAQQGAELKHIYKEAFDKYLINQSALSRYSSRRNRNTEILDFIKQIPMKRQ